MIDEKRKYFLMKCAPGIRTDNKHLRIGSYR